MDEQKKSFQQLMREALGISDSEEAYDDRADLSDETYDLADAEDIEILMHRDAHFGGNFPLMFDYYAREGKGVNQEFSLDRMDRLYQAETSSGEDLASMMLTGADAEKVAQVRRVYHGLRKIYELDNSENPHPKLLADLILSEEEEPTEEIDAIVAQGPAIVPSLLQLLQAREFYDPLYPGYGYAPALAAQCLGKIKDRSAIAPLFEAINAGDFFAEEDIYHALVEIGIPARDFLLKLLLLRPMTMDNERAGRVLTHFALDPLVAKTALQQLQDVDVAKHSNLAAYLVLCCEGLTDPSDRQAFIQLANREDLREFHLDINAIAHEWK